MLAGARIVDPATTYLDWSVALEPGCTIEPFTTLRAPRASPRARSSGRTPWPATRSSAPAAASGRSPTCAPARCSRRPPRSGASSRSRTRASARAPRCRTWPTSATPTWARTQPRRGHDHRQLRWPATSTGRSWKRAPSTSSNSVLVAPVTVGEGSTVAAGWSSRRTSRQGALAIARPRQTNIEGYAERRKARRNVTISCCRRDCSGRSCCRTRQIEGRSRRAEPQRERRRRSA